MKALSEAAEIRPDDPQVRVRTELGDGNFGMSFTNKIDGKSRSLGTWALFRPKAWPNTGKNAKTTLLAAGNKDTGFATIPAGLLGRVIRDGVNESPKTK